MNLVIIAHPDIDSFTSKLAFRISDNLNKATKVINLYKDGFDPVLGLSELRRRTSFDDRVVEYTQMIQKASNLICVYPNWWDAPPAILKGFIDRIFRTGVAFSYKGDDFEEKKPFPLLKDKILWSFVISHAEPASCLRDFWASLCDFTGMELEHHELIAQAGHKFNNVKKSSESFLNLINQRETKG